MLILRKTVVLHTVRREAMSLLPSGFRCVRRSHEACAPSYRGNAQMERVTLRIPKQQIEEVERMVETGNTRTGAKRFGRRCGRCSTSKVRSESSTKRGWAKV